MGGQNAGNGQGRSGQRDGPGRFSWPGKVAEMDPQLAQALQKLAKTLSSTNPCESMIEIVRYTQRNVKRWRDGDMRKRWTAAGMLIAEQQFRRVVGYSHLAKLVIAIERHALLAADKNRTRQEIAEPVTV